MTTRCSGAAPQQLLEQLRVEIEELDRQMLTLLAERMSLAREAGEIKRNARLPLVDPAQEAAVVRRAAVFARESGLPVEEVRQLLWQVIGLCRGVQVEEA